jgi:hypothetical protein
MSRIGSGRARAAVAPAGPSPNAAMKTAAAKIPACRVLESASDTPVVPIGWCPLEKIEKIAV